MDFYLEWKWNTYSSTTIPVHAQTFVLLSDLHDISSESVDHDFHPTQLDIRHLIAGSSLNTPQISLIQLSLFYFCRLISKILFFEFCAGGIPMSINLTSDSIYQVSVIISRFPPTSISSIAILYTASITVTFFCLNEILLTIVEPT
jgi:hypothetical protein